MSLIETFDNSPDGRPVGSAGDNTVASYREARGRALAIVPMVRAERAIFQAIPPLDGHPMLPPSLRTLAAIVVLIVAGAGSVLFSAPDTPLAVFLGGSFGLAVVAAGDRLGAALRGIRARQEWKGRSALAFAVLAHAAEAMLIAVAAALLAESTLVAVGVGALGIIVAAIGYVTRIGDAELEVRAAVRAAAHRKLEASERILASNVDALRAACDSDLARIAAQAGRPIESPRATAGLQSAPPPDIAA